MSATEVSSALTHLASSNAVLRIRRLRGFRRVHRLLLLHQIWLQRGVCRHFEQEPKPHRRLEREWLACELPPRSSPDSEFRHMMLGTTALSVSTSASPAWPLHHLAKNLIGAHLHGIHLAEEIRHLGVGGRLLAAFGVKLGAGGSLNEVGSWFDKYFTAAEVLAFTAAPISGAWVRNWHRLRSEVLVDRGRTCHKDSESSPLPSQTGALRKSPRLNRAFVSTASGQMRA